MKANLSATAEQKRKHEALGDAGVKQLLSMSPKKAAEYIDKEVNDLPTVKAMLKILAKSVCYLLKEGEADGHKRNNG